nr:Deoxyguanosinetriphosphate triphosphohydrolase-like protein [Ipomoea batatas]
MVEDVGGAPFQAVFFDGEQEIGIGDVCVNPMMDFKAFQLMLSQRIGISPNQISIYLCSRKVDRRKIPITGKVNFALIAREKDCYFLAVLKRSRKSRNRKAKMNGGGGAVVDYGDYLSENDLAVSPQPENLILLRRNQPEMSVNMIRNVDPVFNGFGPSYYDQISQAELAGLNDRLNNLQIQRENYAMAMARTNPNLMHLAIPSPNLELDPNNFPRIEDTYWTITAKTEGTTSTCKECMNAKNGKPAAFHPCVNDPVIKGWFRSRAGPVRRTPKTPR